MNAKQAENNLKVFKKCQTTFCIANTTKMLKTSQTMKYMPNNFKAKFQEFGSTNANLATLAKGVCIQQSHADRLLS